jgi:hypothetical protein
VTGAGPGDREPLDAGDFLSWIRDIRPAIADEGGSDVPCAGCTACCRSSQFVPVAPDEHDTIAHIPPGLLFPAPRMPEGHQVLGYDVQGQCPMLVDDRCSIYDHRPRACRAYDCRVFAASGVDPGSEQPAVAERVERWQFSLGSDTAVAEGEACRSAAVFLEDHRWNWPDLATNPIGLATAALVIHDLFLPADGSDHAGPPPPHPQQVRTEVARRLGRAGSSAVEDRAATS